MEQKSYLLTLFQRTSVGLAAALSIASPTIAQDSESGLSGTYTLPENPGASSTSTTPAKTSTRAVIVPPPTRTTPPQQAQAVPAEAAEASPPDTTLSVAQIEALRTRTLAEIRTQHHRKLGQKIGTALATYNDLKDTAAFARTMDAIRFATAQPQLGCTIREMTAVIYLESILGTLANTHEGDAAGMGQIREVTAASLARIYNLNTITPFEGKTPEWFAANRANPYVNALLTCAQINENRVLLDARGLAGSPANLYMMHNMGSEVATDLIRNIRDLSRLRGQAWYVLSQKDAFDLVPISSATGNPGYLMTDGGPANIVEIASRYSSSSEAAYRLGLTIEGDQKALGLPVPRLSFVNGRLTSSADPAITAQEERENPRTKIARRAPAPNYTQNQTEAALQRSFMLATLGTLLVGLSGGGVFVWRRRKQQKLKPKIS